MMESLMTRMAQRAIYREGPCSKRSGRIKGFTFMEVMVVIVIISVMIAAILPLYTKAVEKQKDREAILTLSLIQGAQNMYKERYGSFIASVGPPTEPQAHLDDINNKLKLNLKLKNWFFVAYDGSVTSFIAQAVLLTPPSDPAHNERVWEVDAEGAPRCIAECY